jgi:DNA-binding CsgD family transcriptional regulator
VLTEAILAARRVGATDILGDALDSLGTAWLHDGQYERGVSLLTEALEIAQGEDDVYGAMRAYTNRASGLTLLGDLDEAERVCREGLAFVEASQHPVVHAFYIASNLCEALSEMGRWDERDEVVRTTRRPEGVLPTTWVLHHSLTTALRRGRFDEAQAIVDGVEVDVLSESDPQGLYAFWSGVAQLAVALGDEPRAQRAIAAGLGASGCLPHHLVLRSLLIRLAGRRCAAGDRAALGEAEQELERMESVVAEWLHEPDPRAHRLLAVLHEARAEVTACRGDDASELWTAAIAEWDAGGFRWHAADARLRYGGWLLRAGRRAGAGEALQASAAVAEEIGAAAVAADAARLLAHAGLLPGAPGADLPIDAGPARLTERELSVLGLLAEGKTNRQIGQQLFISPKTASVHVSRILDKLGVDNRTEAAAAGRRAGLVP